MAVGQNKAKNISRAQQLVKTAAQKGAHIISLPVSIIYIIVILFSSLKAFLSGYQMPNVYTVGQILCTHM